MIIKIIIDRFEKDKAILKTDNNETIIWPKNKLPKKSKEGTILTFAIANEQKENTSSRELAKNILNEILNTD